MNTFTNNLIHKRSTKLNSKSLLLTLGLMLSTAIVSFAQTLLYQEGFEDSDDLMTYTANAFRNNADAFYTRMRYDSADLKYTPTGQEGDFIWVTGLVTVPENVNNPEGILSIEDIPITGHTDLQLRMLIGAAKDQFEEDSYMLIEARIDSDNDADYKIIGAFYGDEDGNDDASDKELRQDTDLSGNDNIGAPELGHALQDFTFPISGINGLSAVGDLLDVRIITTNNDETGLIGEEQTIFDNIRVYGTLNLTNGLPGPEANTTAISVINAANVMTFDLADGSGNHTHFTDLTFHLDDTEIADWSDVIAGAKLSHNDGTDGKASSSITANSIEFNNLDTGSGKIGCVNDNGTRTYTLKVWFKSSTNGYSIDGKNIKISFDESDFDGVDKNPIVGSVSNGAGTPIQVDATQIIFTDVPVAVQTDVAFSATIEAQDDLGYIDTDYISSITLSEDDNPGTLASDNLTQNLIAGMHIWNDLTWTHESTFQIDATDGGSLTDATSGDITGDDTPPVISATAPVTDSFVNDTKVSYTLEGDDIAMGFITWKWTEGVADDKLQHIRPLTNSQLTAGVHSNITLSAPPVLVDGAIYTILFDAQDAAGNKATTITNTNVTFDITPPTISPDEISLNADSTQMTFTISEELNLAEDDEVHGFSVSGQGTFNPLGIYSDIGNDNLITLSGSGWTPGSTFVYYFAFMGNVVDLAGNELADINNHITTTNSVTLNPGDIVFTGYIGANTSPDNAGTELDSSQFSFVLLRDLHVGTKIKFTDNGWISKNDANTFTTAEHTISWVATTNLYAGTEVIITGGEVLTASTGSVTGGALFLGTDDNGNQGDQVLAYQGTAGSPAFIAAIHMRGNYNPNLNQKANKEKSALPSGLTDGLNSISFNPEVDNATYKHASEATIGTPDFLRDEIMGDDAHWVTHDDKENSPITFPGLGGLNYDIPPHITDLVPADGAKMNKEFTTLQIHFDENITKSPDFGDASQLINVKKESNPLMVFGIDIANAGITTNTNIASIPFDADQVILSDGMNAESLIDGETYIVDIPEFLFTNEDKNHNEAVFWSFIYDGKLPQVTSIVRKEGAENPVTDDNDVVYTVTFDEAVKGVDQTDFAVFGTAVSGGESFSLDSISPTEYNVTVSGLDLNDEIKNGGDLYLKVVDNSNIQDKAGNVLNAAVPQSQSFTILHQEPSGHVANLAVTATSSGSITLEWKPSVDDGQVAQHYLVIAKEVGVSEYLTVEDKDFVGNNTDIFQDGNGAYSIVVNPNIDTYSYEFTGLKSGTEYAFQVIPYTNGGYPDQVRYNTNEVIPEVTATTLVASETTIVFASASPTVSTVINDNSDPEFENEAGHFVFNITDDGGVAPDPDNSPTLINQIIIEQDDADQIGDWSEAIAGAELSDGNPNNTITVDESKIGTSTITFDGISNGNEQLGEIDDNETKTYTLKVWLKETLPDDLKQTIDQQHFVFRVHADNIAVEQGGSSHFADQPAITSNDDMATNNLVEVNATKFTIKQVESIEGIHQPLINPPLIGVEDKNGNWDLNYPGSFNVSRLDGGNYTTDNTFVFDSSFLDVSSFRYTTTGDGALLIEGENMTSVAGDQDNVDVLNTVLSTYDIAAFTPPGGDTLKTLQSAAKDMTIMGFKLAPNSNGTSPVFKSITIDFKDENKNAKSPLDIFENIRLYKVSAPLAESPQIDDHYVEVIDSKVNEDLSNADSVVIDGFNELLDIGQSPFYYVIVADISVLASGSSGLIKATITPSIDYILEEKGSMTDEEGGSSRIESKLFSFTDYDTPTIVLTNPAKGSFTNYETTSSFSFIFDEPVTYIGDSFAGIPTPDIELRKFVGDSLISDIASLIFDGNGQFYTISFWDHTDPLNPVKIQLGPAEQYYILIAANQFEDESENKHTGLINKGFWHFKTTDTNPPNFVFDDQNELIAHTYDIGFDIKVKLDEQGTAYALAIPKDDPDPDNFNKIKNHDDVELVNITSDNKDFYLHIRGLTSEKEYKLFVAAEDLGGNQMTLNYNDSKSDAQKRIESTVASFDDLVSDPDIALCVGEFQDVTVPITLIEGNDDDFHAGTIDLILPGHYVFDTLALAATATVINDDPDIEIADFWYRNPLTLAVKISGTGNNQRDEIRITGLRIQALPDAADGKMIITGDISDKISYADTVANMLASNLPEASFSLFQAGDIISSTTEEPIALTQDDSVDEFLGESYLFEGNGINNDSLFVSLAPLGENTITLTQTFEGGCQAFGSKTVNITSEQIIGLGFAYCKNSGLVTIPDVLTAGDINNPFNATYILDTLIASVDQIPDGFKGDIDSWDMEDLQFDPGDAIPESSMEAYVSIDFAGVYKNPLNDNDTIPVTQTVRIYPIPTVSIAYNNSADSVIACEDRGDLIFVGTPVDNGEEVTGTYTLTKISSDADLTSSIITVNIDGNAIINTEELKNHELGGSGDYMVSYEYINSNSTCVNTAQMKLTITPKPIANFDIEGTLNGCEDIPVTFTNTTQIDGSYDLEGAAFEWDFGDINNAANNYSNEQTPSHIFTASGTYDISLITTTAEGCASASAEKTVTIGNNPVSNFTYTQIGTDLPTRFTNTTSGLENNQADKVVAVTWKYETGGTILTLEDNNTANVLGDVTHPYTNAPGMKEVTMTVTTFNGCKDAVTKPIFVVPVVVLEELNGTYQQDFEESDDRWIPWGKEEVAANSWTTDPVTGDIITGDSGFWVTGTGAYDAETSYLYSPIFDISALERPLIAFDNMMDVRPGFDGVYLEYQTYDLNSSASWNGGEWMPVGNVNTGIHWYNAENIVNFNNENFSNNLKDYGWSEANTGWRNSRHSLADIPANERKRVQFRFSFITGVGNPDLETPHEGFAFDDFEIGERTRSVLVENFTNTSQEEFVKEESDYLNNTFAAGDANGIEVVKINYHTDFPGLDPVNRVNPTDHGARVAYYDIAAIPQVVLDGDTTSTHLHLFSEWGAGAFGQRSLSLAEFDIVINPTIDPTTGLMDIEVIATPFATVSRPENNLILHVVLMQDSVEVAGMNSGETVLYNVVRDLLPSPTGTFIPYEESLGQFSRRFTWTPTGEYNPGVQSPVEVFDLDLMSIVAFIQDEKERTVYQAALLRSDHSLLSTLDIQHVTGLEGLREDGFALYPNPATDQATIAFGQPIEDEYQLRMYDRFGKLLYEQTIARGTRTVAFDTKPYLNGLYFIRVASSDKVVAHQKLIIMKE